MATISVVTSSGVKAYLDDQITLREKDVAEYEARVNDLQATWFKLADELAGIKYARQALFGDE